MKSSGLPTADKPFHFGVWLETPPFASLTGEGIIQHLLQLLKATADNPGLRVTVACAPWSADDFQKLAIKFGIPSDGFEVLSTGRGIPILLQRLAPKQPVTRTSLLRRCFQRINFFVRQLHKNPPVRNLVIRGFSTDSMPVFFGLLMLAGLLMIPAVLASLLLASLRFFWKLPRRILGKAKATIQTRFPSIWRALQLLRLPEVSHRVIEHEFSILAQRAARRKEIQAWFIPIQSSRLPNLGDRPLIVAVPDVVYVDFAGVFGTTLPGDMIAGIDQRIRKLAGAATRVITYSEYVRDEHVVRYLGVPRERTTVIRHAHDYAPADGGQLTHEAAGQIVRDYFKTDFRPIAWHQEQNAEAYLRDFPFEEVDFLFVSSQIRPHKNLLNVIVAYEKLLRRKHLNIKLVATGSPLALPADVREYLISKRLQWDVLFLPQLPPRVHAAFYRLAKLTVVSTLFEGGFPFPFSESLEVQTPVVMSSIPVTRELLPESLQQTMLFDPYDPDDIADVIEYGVKRSQELLDSQLPFHEALRERTWERVIKEYVSVFRQAAGVEEPIAVDEPSPATISITAARKLRPVRNGRHAFLFLPRHYSGGVWEASRTLIESLLDINRERRELDLTLGVLPEQTSLESLRDRSDELDIVTIDPHQLIPADADVALALVDRFTKPLEADCPYAVVVYDMIQRHIPEVFHPLFFEDMVAGMRPTILQASRVVTTSHATCHDVCDEYGISNSRVEVIPVACEPARRFDGVASESVPNINRPFVLYVANAARHKGAELAIRGYAALKKSLGSEAPLFVQCGYLSQAFAPSCSPQPGWQDPHCVAMRALVQSLDLQEGTDVLFLGEVKLGQLKHLLENAAVVVNAAKFDNGSYCIIEGHYFGRPVVSSRYPAAVELYERFQIPVRYYSMDDPLAFAEAIAAALQEPPVTGDDLKKIRHQLSAPELGYRRYAEQFYGMLASMAKEQSLKKSA